MAQINIKQIKIMAEFIIDIEKMYNEVRQIQSGMPYPELVRRRILSEKDLPNPLDGIPYELKGKAVQSSLTLRTNGESMKFSLPPIMTIQSSINVVETVVTGLDGTVKEVTSTSDYAISIKGFLVSTATTIINKGGFLFEITPTEFPEEELRQLRRFYEGKKSVEVVESKLLSFFNIRKLLIKTYSFPKLEGYRYMCPFELECVSDVDFALKLTKKDVNTL